MTDRFYTLHEAAEAGAWDEANSWDWGSPLLDHGTGGQVAGTVNIIAADSGVGKSFLCLHLASLSPFPSLVISLEESAAEVGRRGKHLPGGPKAHPRVLVHAPSDYTFDDILATIRVAKERHNVRSVFVDYLQLIDYTGTRPFTARTDEIRNILLDLRMLAKELEIAIIVAAQLKEVLQGMDRDEPELKDLADSVSVKRLAWSVVMLWSCPADNLLCAKVKKSKRTAAGTRQFFLRGHGGILEPIPASRAKAMLEAVLSEDEGF